MPVPRAGIEPARPFRAKGFSYHYGFRHHLCLWSGLFLHHGVSLFRCAVSSLCTFLFLKGLAQDCLQALPVKVSLNLRHSTSLLSESALKCALPR